ncbi:hypothetical protein ACFXGA_25865 [Actinosynnema sp. NPDC059335]
MTPTLRKTEVHLATGHDQHAGRSRTPGPWPPDVDHAEAHAVAGWTTTTH